MRGRAIFCIHSWRFSKSDSKNLSIRGIVVPRVMRPAGVALPSFLKARQVLAGWGDALKSRDVLRIAALATASVLVLWPKAIVRSSRIPAPRRNHSRQSSSPHPRSAPRQRRRGAARRPAAQSAAASRRPQPKREATPTVVENPRGAVQGYVAGRSMAGTKTNTPIMQTPQSLSVIGSEQIRDQKPGKFDEILRYTPGVRRRHLRRRHPQRLVPDPRLQVRRCRPVPRRHCSCSTRPMRAGSCSRSIWSASRCCAVPRPCCMAAPARAASSTPSARCRRRSRSAIIETGVNNFGNAYLSVRCRRPGRDAARKRQAVLPRGRPDPERRHPGRFHARQQLFHRAVASPGSRTRTRPSPCWRQPRRPTPAASTSCPMSGTVINAPFGTHPDQIVRRRSQRRQVHARAGDARLSVRAQSHRRA